MFKCLLCDHNWKQWQPPQPWHGGGYDSEMELVPWKHPTEMLEMLANIPVNPECPRCGHFYIKKED